MVDENNNEFGFDVSMKSISLTPALTDLFRPTTKLLGEEIKHLTKNKIDQYKERNRERNLRYHVEKINEIVNQKTDGERNDSPPVEDDNIVDNAEKLLFSLEAVQDIDPVDMELSAIWENLIAELRLGNNISKDLITTMKNVSPQEGRMLLLQSKIESEPLFNKVMRLIKNAFIGNVRQRGMDRYIQESLLKKGLLDKTYFASFLLASVCGVVLSYSCYYYLMLPDKDFDLVTQSLDKSVILIFVLIVPTIVLSQLLVFGINFGFGKYKLTWIGNQLIKKYHK